MRNKLVKVRPHTDQKPPFAIHQDDHHNRSSAPPVVLSVGQSPAVTPGKPSPSKTSRSLHERPSPRSTLAPASEGAINSAMSQAASSGASGKTAPTAPPAAASSSLSPRIPNRMNSTIRTVPSFEDRQRYSEEDSSVDGVQSQSASRDSAFSSSLNSTASMASSISQQQQQQQQRTQAAANGISKMPSIGRLRPSVSASTQDSSGSLPDTTTPRTLRSRPSFADFAQRDSSLGGLATTSPLLPTSADLGGGGGGGGNGGAAGGAGGGRGGIIGSSSTDFSLSATEAHLSNGWDNSVGKAGLGKTGRVINRLVSDNEALKRDIQIERLRAEESRQAARLLEDKLERTISDYESRLLEASVTKTLLARKERQVESLQDAVELERRRAADAGQRERVWKDEMERARAEAKRQVEEATTYAALCEGRYNAISSHWRDQGAEVHRAMDRMRAEVESLAAERRRDDDRIETLRELCDQQDGNIRELTRQKEEIEAQFERYKREQEEALREIKRKADERERAQERTLQEAREVLDKLRWALNVKDKISWAQ